MVLNISESFILNLMKKFEAYEFLNTSKHKKIGELLFRMTHLLGIIFTNEA